LSPEAAAQVDSLRTTSIIGEFPANIDVKTVDLSATSDEALIRLWETQAAPALPWMVVRYPRISRILEDAWSGPFTDTAAKTLLNSPVREETAKRILEGESAVWVLLESGVERQDAAAARLLETQLKKMEETLEVLVPAFDPATGTVFRQGDPDASVQFSMIRVSRDDPAEEAFLRTLLHTEPDLETLNQPMAFPVFGRGRALYALVGDGINQDNIERACRFLVGWCSCQIKELNPGVDLLMSVNWERDVESAPLLATEYIESTTEYAESMTGDETFGGMKRNVLIVVLIQILGVTIVACVVLWRKRRRDGSRENERL
jgi:hypothetical protein